MIDVLKQQDLNLGQEVEKQLELVDPNEVFFDNATANATAEVMKDDFAERMKKDIQKDLQEARYSMFQEIYGDKKITQEAFEKKLAELGTMMNQEEVDNQRLGIFIENLLPNKDPEYIQSLIDWLESYIKDTVNGRVEKVNNNSELNSALKNGLLLFLEEEQERVEKVISVLREINNEQTEELGEKWDDFAERMKKDIQKDLQKERYSRFQEIYGDEKITQEAFEKKLAELGTMMNQEEVDNERLGIFIENLLPNKDLEYIQSLIDWLESYIRYTLYGRVQYVNDNSELNSYSKNGLLLFLEEEQERVEKVVSVLKEIKTKIVSEQIEKLTYDELFEEYKKLNNKFWELIKELKKSAYELKEWAAKHTELISEYEQLLEKAKNSEGKEWLEKIGILLDLDEKEKDIKKIEVRNEVLEYSLKKTNEQIEEIRYIMDKIWKKLNKE